jgi:hypothetical protein
MVEKRQGTGAVQDASRMREWLGRDEIRLVSFVCYKDRECGTPTRCCCGGCCEMVEKRQVTGAVQDASRMREFAGPRRD